MRAFHVLSKDCVSRIHSTANAKESRTGFFIGETKSGAVAECTLNISGVADCIIVGNSVAGCKIYIQAVKIILPLSKF